MSHPPTTDAFATIRDPEARAVFRRAEEARLRRASGGARFGSVRKALGWYFEARARLQCANPMHPQTDVVNAATGERARIAVDGGKGGDLDGTLATMATINEALNRAQVAYPRGTAALVGMLRDGKRQADIADGHRVSQQAISKDVGNAERFLGRELTTAGVVA